MDEILLGILVIEPRRCEHSSCLTAFADAQRVDADESALSRLRRFDPSSVLSEMLPALPRFLLSCPIEMFTCALPPVYDIMI